MKFGGNRVSAGHAGRKSLRAASLLVFALVAPGALQAATYGVPTRIGTDGRVCTGNNAPAGIGCTAAALDPPGYLILTGVDDVDDAGDTVHQMRLFIEVTGTTLDIRVFDAGRSGLRDDPQNGNTSFTYSLRNPAGTVLKTITINGDTGTTEDRVARMSSNAGDTNFVAMNAGAVFTVAPGLHELRITAQNGDNTNDRNAFGVDIRDGTNSAGHYNVYTYGLDDDAGQGTTAPAADTSFIIGALEVAADNNEATITQEMPFYPYVTRGCSLQTSSFDMDGHSTASASVTNILGTSTTLTVSGGTVHSENTVTVYPSGLAAGVQNDILNYGLYQARNHTGTQFNIIDWRLADFRTGNWADNPGGLPRDPLDPLRTYLPNGYTGGVPPFSNATRPGEPVLTSAYAYSSGANPPAVGQMTKFTVQVELTNSSPVAIGLNAANDQIVSGLPTGATNLSNIRCFQGTFTNNVGTPVNGGTFARCNFSGSGVSLASGNSIILSYEFEYTPGAGGAFFITNVPAAPTSGTYNAATLAPNTTTWAQYSRFPTGTIVPETLGPICDMRAATGTLVTRATLGGLRVDPSGTVEFTTVGQRRTAAFNVYATHDPSGRGARTLLNSTPLRAAVSDTIGPVSYRVDTAPITAPYVLVEEIETSGRTRLLGPFGVSDSRMRRALARSEAVSRGSAPASSLRTAAEPLLRERPRVRGTPLGVKIEVVAPGRVTVPLTEIRAGGLPGRVKPRQLHVTNQGGDVPFELVVGAGGAVEAIAFDNPGLSTAYTTTNVFVVSWGPKRPRLVTELTRFEDAPALGVIRVEKDRFYAPAAAQGSDPWLWDFVTAGEPWPRADDPDAGLFDLPDLDVDPDAIVPVRLRLTSVLGGAHMVEARINGVSVGTVTFSGRRPATLVGEIAASELRTLGNNLTLEYAADSSQGGLLYLGHLDVEASPLDPPVADPTRVEPYAPPIEPRRLSRVAYLVITHSAFRHQAEQIASLKTSLGLRAAVVDAQDAYDRYTTGITDARAISRLIADVARYKALKYVLIVGDDSFDPMNRLGASSPSFVPSLFAWDDEFGRIPSEALFADVDGDQAPDVAIGRLPVSDLDQADALVAKIARQGSSLLPKGKQLFAVDNQAPGDPPFEDMATAAQPLSGATQISWARLSAGTDAAREALRLGLQSGVAATHFFGHASFEAWADERVLDTDSVSDLAGSPETVVFAWSCESQWFLWPFGPSLGEALLLLPEGGAVASFGPSGITEPGLQAELLARVYPRFFRDGLSLGEAVRRAKAEAVQSGAARLSPVVHGWNLLGDPSLKLSR